MNIGFYKDLDTNFEQACYLCEKNFTHEELVNMLKSGNIPEKQIAALMFDKVLTDDDANILISSLTGCDGKIREAVAFKIYQITSQIPATRKIFAQIASEKFAAATIDINANICRLVIDTARQCKEFDTFSINYTKCILKYILQALDELDKFIYKDKKYVINKQIFKLYWSLEALKYFYDIIDVKDVIKILKRCIQIQEYTMREKIAQIAILDVNFEEIRITLKNDNNYYVRVALLNHQCLL